MILNKSCSIGTGYYYVDCVGVYLRLAWCNADRDKILVHLIAREMPINQSVVACENIMWWKELSTEELFQRIRPLRIVWAHKDVEELRMIFWRDVRFVVDSEGEYVPNS